MTNRYEEAIACQDAVNPSGVAHTWLDSYKQFRDEGGYTGTESVKRDPALRLIAYKLADLMGGGACFTMNYDHAYEACKRMCSDESTGAEVKHAYARDVASQEQMLPTRRQLEVLDAEADAHRDPSLPPLSKAALRARETAYAAADKVMLSNETLAPEQAAKLEAMGRERGWKSE